MVGGRIPATLQAIFSASNKGEEVHAPPKDKSAFKVFRRGSNNAKVERPKPTFVSPLTGTSIPISIAKVPPQAKFHLQLKERGYFPRNFASKRSAYYNQPSDHQLASYGSAIIEAVKRNKVEDFRRMLEAGLSPNACNQHGESLLHMVCRHGKTDLFRVLVAYDVDFQQTDDYGRTPMHDCCWASQPSFEIAKCLLLQDQNLLFLFDARGSLPLSYCMKSLWGDWNYFIMEMMDEIFPRGDCPHKNETPVLCRLKPNTRPVPDPKDKIPASLANMVATGVMAPYEVLLAMGAYEDQTVRCSEYDSDGSSHSSGDSDDSDEDFDSDEEAELCRITGQVENLHLGKIEED